MQPHGFYQDRFRSNSGNQGFHHKPDHTDRVPPPSAPSLRWKVIGPATVVSNTIDPTTTHHETRQLLPQAEVTRTDEDLRRETGVEGERGEPFSPLLTIITSGST